MPLLEKLQLSSTPQSVAVVHNSLQNLYFVKFLRDAPNVVLRCECAAECSRCSKFRSAIRALGTRKTCACLGSAPYDVNPLPECAALASGESALRSEELAQWWTLERVGWVTRTYPENFQQETVPFNKRTTLRAEFLAAWKTRFPNRPRYLPNPVQRKVLNRLARNEVAPSSFLFYWALGSGKTLVALFYAALFKFSRLLVVCSKTMVAQWLETLRSAKCLSPGTLVVLVTYDKLEMLAHDLPRFPKFDAVVVDECHYYKNLNEAKSLSFQLICKAFPHRVLLSGTPLRHSLEELEMYAHVFGLPRSTSLWSDRVTGSLGSNPFARRVSYYNPNEHRSTEWFYPTTRVHLVRYPLEACHNLAYLVKSGREHKLEVGSVRLPTWGRGDELSRNSLLNQCQPYPGARMYSAKLDVLLDNLRAGAAPQVVFSMYKHFHKELLEKLQSLDLNVNVLTGSESPAERSAARLAFTEGKVDVLLLCRVGSDGLDLYSARTLHVLEPQNNDAETRQVVGRVVRGSLQPYEYAVDVYHYCCTLESSPTVIPPEEWRSCQRFFDAYPEVSSSILQWASTEAGSPSTELDSATLGAFLRAANESEAGSVEEKRNLRNEAGAVALQKGLAYLKEADLFSQRKAPPGSSRKF